AVRVQGLRLGDHVERPAGVELQVDVGERLEPRAEARGGPADALGHAPDLPGALGEDRDDAVGLPQLLGAQHHALIPVEAHQAIVRPGPACPAAAVRGGLWGTNGETSVMIWPRSWSPDPIKHAYQDIQL